MEDVLVKVDQYIFSTDFIVHDLDEDVKVPLILGRPFLCTSKALTDMDGGEMTLSIGDKKITYRLAEAMRHSLVFDDSCYFLHINDELVDDQMQELIHPIPFEVWLEEEGDSGIEPVDDETNEKSPPGNLKKIQNLDAHKRNAPLTRGCTPK